MSERRKEAGIRGASKRWNENSKNIANATENDSNCYENDSKWMAKCENAMAKNSKEINKKIKKEINKEKNSVVDTPTSGETVEAKNETSETLSFSFFKKNSETALNTQEMATNQTPVSGRSHEKNTEKMLLNWDFFIKNYPKQTKIFEAQNAFLSLTNEDRKKLETVFSFWIAYWKTIEPIYVPNPYDFIKNRRFLEKIPEKFGNFGSREFSKNQPKMDTIPQIDDKKLSAEKNERAKILEFFESMNDEKKSEIIAQIEGKYQELPVKKGDILWQIELVKLVKPMFENV